MFWFFHYYIFSFFFTVLVVHPHHDHPVTTVLTRSTFLWHDVAFCAESAVKHKSNKQIHTRESVKCPCDVCGLDTDVMTLIIITRTTTMMAAVAETMTMAIIIIVSVFSL